MKNSSRMWFWLAAAFLICGGIHLLMSWFRYNTILTAVPFSFSVLLHLLGYGGAAAVCLLVGWILKRKEHNRKDDIR